MSVSSVITQGLGGFGSVNLLPTLGYSVGTARGVTLLGGGPGKYSYVPAYQKHRDELKEKELAELQRQIKAAQDEEAETEALLLEAKKQDQQKEAIRLAALEIKAQAEIRRLLEERARLIRRLRDEEEALILLYSLPFVH